MKNYAPFFSQLFFHRKQTRLHLQGKVARRAMCSKNKKMRTLPQMILRSCNPAIMRSCNPAIMRSCNPAILNKISISAIIQQTWTTKWRKHTYKQAKEIPKLVLFRRSHVRHSCNPAIRSDALHHTDRQTDRQTDRHSHMLFLVPDPWSGTQ